MSYLEDLIGQPLHELSDEELEEVIMRGRLAREEESQNHTPKRKASTKTSAPVKIATVCLDDDEFDDMPD